MDIEEIRKWHRIFKHDGELFEIRILGDRTWSGYFYDVEDAIANLQPYDTCNIYFSVNEVKKACASRSQFGCFKQVKGTATSKQDIEHRWWIPIDVDCERPSGVSSTDDEKKLAHTKAGDVYRFLKTNGFPEPMVCDSSSGYHIYIPVDIDNTADAETAVKTFLDTLGNIFTDGHVKIDNVLFDANRIIRLPGTYGRKGRDTVERPHRLARILSAPDEIARVDLTFITNFNAMFKVSAEPVQRHSSYGGDAFDIRKFISDHGIGVAKEIPIAGGGTKFVLDECIFDSGHKAPDAAIFQMPNGAIAYKCFHQSCSSYRWEDVRTKFEPDAYSHTHEYRSIRPTISTYQPLPPKAEQPPTQPQIIAESEEKGHKWLSMREIEKVDLADIDHILTGYTGLDSQIKGLFAGEITIVSGNNSSGKSTWLNNLMLNIVDQGWKTALWSGELQPFKLKTWIHMVAAGKKRIAVSRKGYYYVPNDIATIIDDWLEGKFFLYNNNYGSKWAQILSDMEEMAGKEVRVFILDNLMSLDIDIFSGDKNDRQKALLIQLVEFAKENNAHIILVAHPRKAATLIRKYDISGTSDITNLVDNVFLIHRNNEDFKRAGKEYFGAQRMSQLTSLNYGNIIEVAKNRLEGVQDLLVGTYFEIESRRFKNTEDEERVYGCFRQGEQSEMFSDAVEQAKPTLGDPFGPPIGDCPF